MKVDTHFEGDDIRKVDPKFKPKRLPQYVAAVEGLESIAADRGKTVIQLAVRWVLDQPGSQVALWGARHPDQLKPLDGICDWELSAEDLQRIDAVIEEHVLDPIGPEFMAPPSRVAK